MKKNSGIIIAVLVVAALVLIKIFLLPSQSGGQAGADKQGKGMPSPVSVLVVQPEVVNNKLYITGNVIANEEVNLVPETQGKVISVFFKEGSNVNKGQLLLKLNDAELQAQLKKLKLNEQLATEKEARQKKLLGISGISQEEYDATLTTLNGIKADIELLNAQLAKTEIKAPFSGIIGLTNITEGTFVSPTTTIATLQSVNPVKIDFFIPEKYAGTIHINETIGFTPGSSNERFTAKISAIQPKADASTHTIEVHATCSNENGKIFPGVFARIDFSPAKNENSILVPTEAVIPFLKGQKVFVVRNGLAEEAVVQTGMRSATKVQIMSGLNAGDSLVVSGILSLKKSSPVKIVGGKKK